MDEQRINPIRPRHDKGDLRPMLIRDIERFLRHSGSLVGPRPHALGSRAGNDLFWQASKKYWLRHALKPGITGLAQIRGFRGATEHAGDLEKRVRCDLEYLTNWSIGLDLIIMIKTINVVVHKNAY